MKLEDMILRTVQRNFLKKHGFSFKKEYFDLFFYSSVFFIALSSFFIEKIDVFFILVLLSQVSMAIPSLLICFTTKRLYRDDGYINFYIYSQKNQFVSLLILSCFFYFFKPDIQTGSIFTNMTTSCFFVVFTLSFVSLLSLLITKMRFRFHNENF